MRVDIGIHLIFLEKIIQTHQRQDTIIYSNKTMQVIMLKLAASWDENTNKAHENMFG